MQELLTIGEVAERSGLAASAIRFYERQGLIHAERTPSGQRRFRRDVLRRIAFIRIAQRVGLSLDEIVTALAELPKICEMQLRRRKLPLLNRRQQRRRFRHRPSQQRRRRTRLTKTRLIHSNRIRTLPRRQTSASANTNKYPRLLRACYHFARLESDRHESLS